MSLRTIIFFVLLAVALGATIPETIPEENSYNDAIEPEVVFGDTEPAGEDVVLVRQARSPQSSMSGSFLHNGRDGSSAMIDFNRQLSKNLDVYAGASRNFKFNQNGAHAGLRYRF